MNFMWQLDMYVRELCLNALSYGTIHCMSVGFRATFSGTHGIILAASMMTNDKFYFAKHVSLKVAT